MPNRVIGKFVHNFYNIEKRLSHFLRTQRIFYEVKNIEPPFDFESGVEIRTPEQVMIKKELYTKNEVDHKWKILKMTNTELYWAKIRI